MFYNEAHAVRTLSFGLLQWLTGQRLNHSEITVKERFARLSFSFIDLLVNLLALMEELFFLNFYVSILLELGLSLAQFCLPAYTKLQSIHFDLGIKLPGWTFPCLAV